MRILVVQESDWIDRNPILHHRMLESMALAGDEVLVLDYDIRWRGKGRRPLVERRREIRDATKFFPDSGVVVVRPAMLRIPGVARPSWLVMTAIELLKAFRHFRPHVVVAYGISNALVARAMAAYFRVPFVFHIFDSLHALAEPPFLASVARIVEKSVLRAADIVVVAHRGLLDYVAGMGVRSSRIRFIMNGFATSEISPTRANRVRQKHGIAADEVMILFVGWLYPHSGLIEVARILLESEKDPYKLVVAGDGDILSELMDLSRQSKQGNRLVLLGKVPVGEIPELIGAADVCLFSATPTVALQHVVPSKVDEYLEVGRPVIATRLPGMLAEFRDLESVIWIDGPQDALRSLDTVLAGQTDPRSALRHLGMSARAYGQGRETWPVVTTRFRAALAEAQMQHPRDRGASS